MIYTLSKLSWIFTSIPDNIEHGFSLKGQTLVFSHTLVYFQYASSPGIAKQEVKTHSKGLP